MGVALCDGEKVMEFVTVTIEHRPEGEGTPDNTAWTKTFSGENLAEVLMQIAPWAMLY